MTWARKPKLERLAADDVALYSTDQLRAAYHDAASGYDERCVFGTLRNCIVTRAELVQEIRYRVAVEARRFQLIAWLTFIAAIASLAAAFLAFMVAFSVQSERVNPSSKWPPPAPDVLSRFLARLVGLCG